MKNLQNEIVFIWNVVMRTMSNETHSLKYEMFIKNRTW